MWGPADAILQQLLGTWTIRRSISNGASLAGVAAFAQIKEHVLLYEERGELRLADGQRFAATRSYRFHQSAVGFDVRFAEEPGKLFHAIALAGREDAWTGEGEHPCRDDLYRTRYVFRPDGTFAVTHVVRGPRHHYDMATTYCRQA